MKPLIYIGIFIFITFTLGMYLFYGVYFPNHHFLRGMFHFPYMMLFWIVILIVIFINLSPKNSTKKPIEILKNRLANGEITISEFQTLKKQIEEETNNEKY
jgi:uncharacterized membrane protein